MARAYHGYCLALVAIKGYAMSKVVRKVAAPTSPVSEVKEPSGKTRPDNEIKVTVNGVRIDVSPELEKAVHRAQKGLSRPLPPEMTTTQAAEFLDVSRPFVIKLTQRGELPCRLVGKHRRIPSGAVLDYREKMFQQARQAADEMAQLSQAAGLDEQGPRRKAQ
jgi:excisionase family DNA binding protein